jgi:hypothetical protein
METVGPAVEAEAEAEAEAEEAEENPLLASQAASRKRLKIVASVLDQANKHRIMK